MLIMFVKIDGSLYNLWKAEGAGCDRRLMYKEAQYSEKVCVKLSERVC